MSKLLTLPSGTIGFTLYDTVKLLSAEWGIDQQRIFQILWSDFKAGLFDSPAEKVKPETQKELTDIITTRGAEDAELYARCWIHLIVELNSLEYAPAEERMNSRSDYQASAKDGTLFLQIIIPCTVIAVFCARWNRAVPECLLSENREAVPTLPDQVRDPLVSTVSVEQYGTDGEFPYLTDGEFSYSSSVHVKRVESSHRRHRVKCGLTKRKEILCDLCSGAPRAAFSAAAFRRPRLPQSGHSQQR